jgi:4a-hydroxytetrahydrobiopterin dehydratase
MTDALNPDALHHELDRLPGWSGTTEGISRTFEFSDFAGSIVFVNRVAEHAEGAGHHPDITINWNKVTLTYVTHAVGGVTQADIEQAREVTDLGPGNDSDDVETKPDA